MQNKKTANIYLLWCLLLGHKVYYTLEYQYATTGNSLFLRFLLNKCKDYCCAQWDDYNILTKV